MCDADLLCGCKRLSGSLGMLMSRARLLWKHNAIASDELLLGVLMSGRQAFGSVWLCVRNLWVVISSKTDVFIARGSAALWLIHINFSLL